MPTTTTNKKYEIGQKLYKDFMSPYLGEIFRTPTSKDQDSRFYKVLYEDGDVEDLNINQVREGVAYFERCEKDQDENQDQDQKQKSTKKLKSNPRISGDAHGEDTFKVCVGTKILKDFVNPDANASEKGKHEKMIPFVGTIKAVPNGTNVLFYKVLYEDGDKEDFSLREVKKGVAYYIKERGQPVVNDLIKSPSTSTSIPYKVGTKILKDFPRSFQAEIIGLPRSEGSGPSIYKIRFMTDGSIEEMTADEVDRQVKAYEFIKKHRTDFVPSDNYARTGVLYSDEDEDEDDDGKDEDDNSFQTAREDEDDEANDYDTPPPAANNGGPEDDQHDDMPLSKRFKLSQNDFMI